MSHVCDVVDFDPMSRVYFRDPYELYRRLRDEAPVYHSSKYGFYALSRYHDVIRAHRDWKGLSSTFGIEFFDLLKREQQPEAFRSIIVAALWWGRCLPHGRLPNSSR